MGKMKVKKKKQKCVISAHDKNSDKADGPQRKMSPEGLCKERHLCQQQRIGGDRRNSEETRWVAA